MADQKGQKPNLLCTSEILRKASHQKASETLTFRVCPALKEYVQSLPRGERAAFIGRAIRHYLLMKVKT